MRSIHGVMFGDTKEEIERRMDELAREYKRTSPGEIANELSCAVLAS
jgi:hypothetical protein